VISNLAQLEKIEDEAFAHNSIISLKFDLLPKLKAFGIKAFAGNKINKIDFGFADNNDIVIQEYAFSDNEISHISNFENIAQIQNGAFFMNNLPAFQFKNHRIKSIHSKAFAKNKLENIDLSGMTKLKELEKGAFMDNENVKTITLGSNIETIADSVFEGSVSKLIQKLKIPNSVISIGKYAFKGMTKDFFENQLCWDMSGTEKPKVHKDAFFPNSLKDKLHNKCI
jgi:hypothetical protein